VNLKEKIKNGSQQTAIEHKGYSALWMVRGFGDQRQITDLAFEMKS